MLFIIKMLSIMATGYEETTGISLPGECFQCESYSCAGCAHRKNRENIIVGKK